MSSRATVAICGGFLALSAAFAGPQAEPVDMPVRRWSTREGLPNNHVGAVIRTGDGFLWLATDGGAVRFDGQKFKVVGMREGLTNPIVTALRETRDHGLWVGTLGGGVSVMHHNRIQTTYTTADGLPSNWVTGFEEDEQGGLIVLSTYGRARFNNGRFEPLPKAASPFPITSILRDGGGVLRGIAQDHTLCVWQNGKWTPAADGGPTKVDVLAGDRQGRLLAAASDKLWIRESGAWTSHPLPEGFQSGPVSIAGASDGTVWLAFYRQGLCGYKDGRFITPNATGEFSPNQTESVFTTPDGQLWITSIRGLYRLTAGKIRSARIDDPEAKDTANIIGGLVEITPGEFVVGTQGSGLYRWKDGRTTRLELDSGPGSDVVANVAIKARNGSIWLGAKQGLYELKPDGTIRRQTMSGNQHDLVWSLAESPEGLWVGTGWGELKLFADGKFQNIDYGSKRAPVKALAREPDGTFWVGTRGDGLFRRKGNRWEHFDRAGGLPGDSVRTLHLDPENRLWMGFDGGGLALARKDGRFISVTTREGLPNDTVSQLYTDHAGRLWVGTNKGLAIFDKEAQRRIAAGDVDNLTPLRINETDGLPDDELTIVPPLETSDGSVAFATLRGFFRLKPDDFQPARSSPPVFLEELRANGNPVDIASGHIALPAGTDRLEIAFGGLNFHDPSRLKFRSRLGGLNDDWVGSGDRGVAEYRNLRPGTYRFKVQASTDNGLWSASPAVVDIVIAPRFWQTGWFTVVVLSSGLGAVAGSVWLLERRRNRAKIEKLQRRQAVDAERARIARDLHDDVGSSLTQIGLEAQLVETLMPRNPAHAANHLQEIFKTSVRVTRTLDEIIWAVNPGHDTVKNFVLFLVSHTQGVAESAGMTLRLDVPENPSERMMPSSVRQNLYLSAKEALHNILKHAGASEISLCVKQDEHRLVIIIGDDGKGFGEDPADIGADGLINMRERLEKIRGTCVRHSAPGRGTTVEMSVPSDWRES